MTPREAHRKVRLASFPESTAMDILRLRDDLSYCLVDGHPIFLDIREDRYFRLSGELERLFLSHIDSTAHAPQELAPLIERDILTKMPRRNDLQGDIVPIATCSALEAAPARETFHPGIAAEVFATVCWTQIQLKARPLKAALDHLIDRRCRRVTQANDQSRAHVLGATAAFLNARKFVPIETCCLLDSLSIADYLARRHLHANIVFGVTGDPFSAHCWAQFEDVVLSDTTGHIRAYSVIRVI